MEDLIKKKKIISKRIKNKKERKILTTEKIQIKAKSKTKTKKKKKALTSTIIIKIN